jgi:hypothetical protein
VEALFPLLLLKKRLEPWCLLSFSLPGHYNVSNCPITCSCHKVLCCHRPKAARPSDHGLIPMKLWASFSFSFPPHCWIWSIPGPPCSTTKMYPNLSSSFKVAYFGHFVTVLEKWQGERTVFLEVKRKWQTFEMVGILVPPHPFFEFGGNDIEGSNKGKSRRVEVLSSLSHISFQFWSCTGAMRWGGVWICDTCTRKQFCHIGMRPDLSLTDWEFL